MSNSDNKILELKNLVDGAELSLQQARKILEGLLGDENAILTDQAKKFGSVAATTDGQVVEGFFDGQNMLGPDDKRYSVPANYASKSKLVEGDGLKLTITSDGSFVYKQINLLERERLVGLLAVDEKTDEYRVAANNKAYKVLTASITYYKGEEGDRVTILVPKGKESSWAAVENIFKAGDEIPGMSTLEDSTDKKATETAKMIFDEVKLPEEEKEVNISETEKLPAPAENNPMPEAGDSFLSEDGHGGETLYGPTIPLRKDANNYSNFLSEEKNKVDDLGDKDKQGLEEL
ncbi:hypothetical protein A3E04_00780 [Candidatus Kuenenbacteria bacterium RIFCSPHIGHO2_12_FULL_42_14]|uniref:50S ribosomal protein L7/L12 n=2 Tax=Candidatus Kueneniibacteriota TaxID=1752740 RepID=A0A1F6GKF7_9BACT|nr:MAG: hypothetical protein A3C68_02140 [Candidatus Kuenenbacteria bacterium RIFCSPHIGHO2_02_FULL_42_29]OGG90584.1 MAG: hypothetical protein A3H55_03885 [Candidatus Kuenenbacteria bacterium RIFCSPLOWO2_02_FULL_42_16]OGG98592.1 MAG: hypothetical protein A3E04_00780 [Candidatus Kuenenbacteria bacterium RIFCSPHIGHO2_12_FULL_42_14]